MKGYKILFDILYNGNHKLKISDVQIAFQKRNLGVSKLNLRIVKIFIDQLFFTLKK